MALGAMLGWGLAASALAAPGDVYVADQNAGPASSGAIFEVDLATRERTQIAAGEPLQSPAGMTFDHDGRGGTGRDRCNGKGSKDRSSGCERRLAIP